MKDIFTTSKCLSADQIKKYLQEGLNDEEQYQIENHLLDCELCNDAVEGYANHFNFEEDEQILSEIKSAIDQQIPAKETPVRSMEKRFSLQSIAAALLLFVFSAAGLMYWNSNQQQDLFGTYYEPYESNGLVALRGDNTSNSEIQTELKKALMFYEQKKFKNSIPHFEAYLTENQENTNAAFHAGLAYLETGDFSNAIDQLRSVRLNDEKSYEDATWYLIMANLKKNNLNEVKLLLKDLIKIEDGFYLKKAKALLEDLEG